MSENKRNFLVHGGILAMAGILVRIIGMFYRIPLVNIIGSDGNGIYGAAYNVYNIMLVLSAYGLPMAVSKLVSAKFVAKQFKNAASIFKCALILRPVQAVSQLFYYSLERILSKMYFIKVFRAWQFRLGFLHRPSFLWRF